MITQGTKVATNPNYESLVSMPESMLEWIHGELNRGCAVNQIQAMMDATGWPQRLSVPALQQCLPPPAVPVLIQQGAFPNVDVSSRASVLDLGDRQVSVLLAISHPRIVVLGGFLSYEECDALMEGASSRIERSLGQSMTGDSIVSPDRTSDGMSYHRRGENPTLQTIENRIAKLTQWPVEYGEPIQVLNYQPGAQYKPHQDYFDPENESIDALLARGGQRVGTVLMYLNTPEAGGGTTFPDINLTVFAQRGNAVFFGYEIPDASMQCLHGGDPVIAGTKWAATKWLREREFDKPPET